MVIIRASWLQLKTPFIFLLVAVGISVMASTIVALSLGSDNHIYVSIANLLTVSLVIVGSVLPVFLFSRMINLGSNRKEYYLGLIITYLLFALGFAIFNTIWLQMEINWFRNIAYNFKIVEIFQWDQFGITGMVLYQFSVYFLVLSLLNLLFSGLQQVGGWMVWIILIAAIPIGTSIPSLRPKVAEGFTALLFNDSSWQGSGIDIICSIMFLVGGWLLTWKRQI